MSLFTEDEKQSLMAALRKNPKVRDPEALAAWIGRKIGGRSRKGRLRDKAEECRGIFNLMESPEAVCAWTDIMTWLRSR